MQNQISGCVLKASIPFSTPLEPYPREGNSSTYSPPTCTVAKTGLPRNPMSIHFTNFLPILDFHVNGKWDVIFCGSWTMPIWESKSKSIRGIMVLRKQLYAVTRFHKILDRLLIHPFIAQPSLSLSLFSHLYLSIWLSLSLTLALHPSLSVSTCLF